MLGRERIRRIDEASAHPVLPILVGALAGAVVVLGMAAALGGLIDGLAAPPVLAVFALAGAIFGALAYGAISYERRRRPPIGRAG